MKEASYILFIKRILPIIIIILISILYTRPFFSKGYFPTHDGEWAIVRLAEMWREIRDLQIPPRWSDYLNHGFGYPLFSFTYPFPYYLGLIPKILGLSFTDSIKVLFVGSVFFSAIFMYLLGKEIAGKFAGLLAAIFYIVAPYRLVDLYVRGSIGESLSFVVFPFLFYISLKYILNPTLLRLLVCSIVFGMTILTHNVMAILFFPIWILFLYTIVISYFENMVKYTFFYFIPMILLGLGLAAFFFIPAFFEKNNIILSQIRLAKPEENFISLPEIISSSWSYGIKPSVQLGMVQILGMVVSFISIIFSGAVNRKKFLPVSVFIILSIVVLIFLSNKYSIGLWAYPPLTWIDFPWRLLGPLIFLVSLSTVFLSISKITKFLGLVIAIVAIMINLQYAKPYEYFQKNDDYYLTNDATTTSMDELMPIWVAEKPTNRYSQKVEVLNGDAIISNLKFNSHSIYFDANSSVPSTISINTLYFPGWILSTKSQKIQIDFSNPGGLMRFNLPVGSSRIVGRFTRTGIRFMGDTLTLLSIVIVILLLGKALILDRILAFRSQTELEPEELTEFPSAQTQDEDAPSQ